MQTRILLLAALSVASGAAVAQNQLRVDPEVQRQRDQTRITILQDELVSEALALAEVQKLFRSDAGRADPRATQESSKAISRHRQNISALAKELALSERQSGAAARVTPAPAIERRAVEPLPLGQVVAPIAPREAPVIERRSRIGQPPEWLISGSQGQRTP